MIDFYFFGGRFTDELLRKLSQNSFAGVLFTYDATQGDFFVKVARDIRLDETIKYMIAIRPYTISPQYLCMINKAMNDISKDRLQINIIAGHIKNHEKDFGGFVDEIKDTSSNIDRSNYLIKYIKVLEEMRANNKVEVPDYYVSSTNQYVYNESCALGSKIIIPYNNYKHGHWVLKREDEVVKEFGEKIDLSGQKLMLSISAILRETQDEIDALEKEYISYDTEYFTYDQFYNFTKKVESDGINEILLTGWPTREEPFIIDFVNKYNNSNYFVRNKNEVQ